MEVLDIKDKIGNPLFVIETYLNPLIKDIKEDKVDSALQIVERIRVSIEKIKEVLHKIVEDEKSVCIGHKGDFEVHVSFLPPEYKMTID
jgi:hypothetical protein